MVSDFHSHVLPGIDDGSSSVEESIGLLKIEAQQGFRRVVATPHFYAHHDSPERFLARRNHAYEILMDAIGDQDGFPDIILGGEVYYFPGISDSDIIPALTIDNKRCILIEMPFNGWTNSMFDELVNISEKHGITPIVAHVDRYIRPFATHHIPERLEQMPVLVQANASFFLDRGTRSMAFKMLKKRQIHILGSDCHNLVTRPPKLGDAIELIEKRFGSGILDEIRENEEIALSAEL